jgi:hypothetical protein
MTPRLVTLFEWCSSNNTIQYISLWFEFMFRNSGVQQCVSVVMT